MNASMGLLAVLLMLGSTSLGQTAASQQTGPVQQTAQVQSAPSTEAAAASAGAGAAAPVAVPFAAGAKIFLEPMDGFEQFLSRAIVKKKVPVVVVKERAKADFVVSGEARVKKRGFFTGFVLDTHGGGDISIKDARTGKQVFGYSFHRVDQGVADFYLYQGWAEACANHLKKALEKK